MSKLMGRTLAAWSAAASLLASCGGDQGETRQEEDRQPDERAVSSARDNNAQGAHVAGSAEDEEPHVDVHPDTPPKPDPCALAAASEACAATPVPTAESTSTRAAETSAVDEDELTCYPLLAHGDGSELPYEVGVATDELVAFTLAAPWQETSFGVLFRPVIDNSKSVHHWLLYQDNSPGTPGDVVVQTGVHPDSQLIAAWAPGADPLDFRTSGVDVALELPHDTTYTLELHYNSSDPAAVDRSGVEVCTHPRKPEHTAGYSWLGTENFLLPPEWHTRDLHRRMLVTDGVIGDLCVSLYLRRQTRGRLRHDLTVTRDKPVHSSFFWLGAGAPA